jgi:hydrogenase-4 membrane subunit HyfE
MEAIDNQFRAALAFAYAFVIVRVLAALATGQPINVLAVVATYLLLGLVALGLRRSMHEATDARYARTMAYVTLGAFAATAPEFW